MAPLSLMNMLTNLGVADSDVVLISTSSDTVCAYIGNEQNNANAKPKNKFVRFSSEINTDNIIWCLDLILFYRIDLLASFMYEKYFLRLNRLSGV